MLRTYSQVGMYEGYPKRRHDFMRCMLYNYRALSSARSGRGQMNGKIGNLIEGNAWLDLGDS